MRNTTDFNIGDHVYHTNIEANGIIVDIDDTKRRDMYKVHFPWAKYCRVRYGSWKEKGTKGTKWQFCGADSLVKLDMPIDFGGYGQNKVTMVGKRSLDRLVRLHCGLKPRRPRDGSDIILNYGTLCTPQSAGRVPASIFMLNRNIVANKLEQMKMMGEDLCPESSSTGQIGDPADWIIKPYHSIGGKGIRPAAGSSLRYGEYYQRKFNKVREFRVHCFRWLDNPVPFVQAKVIDDPNQLCWNKKQGGKFRYVYQEGLEYGNFIHDLSMTTRNMMTKMAVEALEKLDYDLGGIDFGLASDGTLKIFEVNSRMGLRERSFFTYKQAFGRLKTMNLQQYIAKRGGRI